MKKPIVTSIEPTTPAAAPAAVESYVVAKPFNTPNRRFAKDAKVARADLAGTPLDFDHMVARGFIVAG